MSFHLSLFPPLRAFWCSLPPASLTLGRLEDGTYLLISSCKDGNPMLRSWLGDWIGTFLGELRQSR